MKKRHQAFGRPFWLGVWWPFWDLDLPHDQKRPFIADLRNGARDGAGLRRKVRAAHQKSLLFLN
jgi:hypothetical protein